MARCSIGLDPALHAYLLRVSLRDSAVKARLRAETGDLDWGCMQVAPEEGQFLGFLASLLGARRVVEIGTFTGYSTLCLAEALPADGQIVTCDIDDAAAARARPAWTEADVAARITFRSGPGVASLDALLAEGDAESFDLAFIDADKESYDAYYERCLRLVRQGGVIAIDNVLWGGSVVDPAKTDSATEAIRTLNQKLHTDNRIDLSMLPLGDGVTLCRKR